VVGGAGDGSVRIPGAALRVGVLEAPLDRQVRAELGDEELLRARRIGRRAVRGTDRRVVAVGAETAIVVVLASSDTSSLEFSNTCENYLGSHLGTEQIVR
jgi:hypothetical protein